MALLFCVYFMKTASKTIGLFPAPIRPIISTCFKKESSYNCISAVIRAFPTLYYYYLFCSNIFLSHKCLRTQYGSAGCAADGVVGEAYEFPVVDGVFS